MVATAIRVSFHCINQIGPVLICELRRFGIFRVSIRSMASEADYRLCRARRFSGGCDFPFRPRLKPDVTSTMSNRARNIVVRELLYSLAMDLENLVD